METQNTKIYKNLPPEIAPNGECEKVRNLGHFRTARYAIRSCLCRFRKGPTFRPMSPKGLQTVLFLETFGHQKL